MIIINLDSTLKPINYYVVSKGLPNRTTSYNGEIIKTALLSNASSVIMIHNHPDGLNHFSYSDIMASIRLDYLLSFVDIELRDSVLIPNGGSPKYLITENEEDFCSLKLKYNIKLKRKHYEEFKEITDKISSE